MLIVQTRTARLCKVDLRANVTRVDVVRGGMIVYCGDGTAAFFDAQFLYAP